MDRFLQIGPLRWIDFFQIGLFRWFILYQAVPVVIVYVKLRRQVELNRTGPAPQGHACRPAGFAPLSLSGTKGIKEVRMDIFSVLQLFGGIGLFLFSRKNWN